MRSHHLLLVLVLAAPPARAADRVLYNGHVFTGTALRGATCVAVSGDRIVYVGDDAGAPSFADRVDLGGALVVPGLVDAHAHMQGLGRSLAEISLLGTTSATQAAGRVRDGLGEHPPGSWVHGRGWDQNDWETKAFPSWRDLAGTDSHPVYLDRVDGHAIWVNRAALDRCGIARDTPDPPGGRIVRDDAGEPTGILVDNAELLVTERIPPATAAEVEQHLRRAIRECNRVGLTGVHDAGVGVEEIDAYRRIGAAGGLTVNVYAMIDSDDPGAMRAAFRTGPAEEFGGRLVVRSVKLRADGALGSRGAALLAPYDDDPGNAGLVVTPPESLLAWTTEALRAGFQPATHAIGDRGNRLILDAYEGAQSSVGAQDARARVEHCQVLAPADVGRFAALGVIASMQPTHATSDMPWVEARIGRARMGGAYAWRSLLGTGAVLAFGSDAPVESIDPLWGIYAAVTRCDHGGQPAGGWLAGERVTMDEALRGFTWGAAYAAFDEAEAGTIEAGRRADLTVIDRDITGGTPATILSARVVLTVVRGDVVYDAGVLAGRD
jgi:predicted amidohydrolase YtcJ